MLFHYGADYEYQRKYEQCRTDYAHDHNMHRGELHRFTLMVGAFAHAEESR